MVELAGVLEWWPEAGRVPAGELWLPPQVELVPGPGRGRAGAGGRGGGDTGEGEGGEGAAGGGFLAWWPVPDGWGGDSDAALRAWRTAPPDRLMLARFLGLGTAPACPGAGAEAERVAAFVHRYGPLGLGPGPVPAPRPELVHPGAWFPAAMDSGHVAPVVEPVAAYRALARRMAAILRVLAACVGPDRDRRLRDCRDDLTVLIEATGAIEQLPVPVADYAASLAADPAGAQELALNHLDVLLIQARPALDLRLRPAPWERPSAGAPAPWPTGLTVWPRGAFAVLVVQLAAAVTALPQQALCDGCGAVYTPRRRPRAGEAHYCARCGREGGYRLSKRRWWARHGQGQRARQGQGQGQVHGQRQG